MFFLKPLSNSIAKTNKTFSEIIDDFFNDSYFPIYDSFKIDIKENDNAYLIEAEMPGIKKDEIRIEYKDDQLIISVHKENKIDEEKENYIHKERRMSSMRRSFYLKGVKEEEISAKLEDGILTITAPKSISSYNRVIEIK